MNIKPIPPGTKFTRLIVERTILKRRRLHSQCVCQCGTRVEVDNYQLRSGHTRSCGCLKSEVTSARNFKHGACDTRAFECWAAMRQRVTNPNNKSFHNYGERGISTCERWHTFSLFFSDMGDCPPKMTLERVDNGAGYTCGKCDDCLSHGWKANCRWATRHDQNRNTRRTRHFTVNGFSGCLMDISRKFSIHYGTLQGRLRRGLTIEQAVMGHPCP